MNCCACGEPCGAGYVFTGDRYMCLKCFDERHLEPIRRTYDADELGIDQEDDD